MIPVMSGARARRLLNDEACRAEGQRILAAAARSYRHLSPELRAEAERLITLPYGAEDHALRRFVADHHPLRIRRAA